VRYPESRPWFERLELLAVKHVLGRSRRDEHVRLDGDVAYGAMPQHGHEWHESGPAGNEKERPGLVGRPREVAADRPADLELVAWLDRAGEVRRHLAVLDVLDGDLDVILLRRGRDGIGPLGLVAVFRGEPHVEMLAGAVSRPARDVEDERTCPRRLGDGVAHRRGQPREAAQSPAYRCSRHGSP
jgi:hypothetical protein